MKKLLKWLGLRLFPKQYWRLTFKRYSQPTEEKLFKLALELSKREKISVDVGAAVGFVATQMLSFSREVVAFEPRPHQAKNLRTMFSICNAPVRVESVALSNCVGITKMRILTQDQGRSTIESENPLLDEDNSHRETVDVEIRRLDDYKLDEVGFIKLDVEGHELAALQGAQTLLERDHPVIYVELEERHKKGVVEDTNAFLNDLGYSGFFLLENSLHPIANFKLSEHQNKNNIGSWRSGWEQRGVYVNNFLFIENARINECLEAAQKL